MSTSSNFQQAIWLRPQLEGNDGHLDDRTIAHLDRCNYLSTESGLKIKSSARSERSIYNKIMQIQNPVLCQGEESITKSCKFIVP